MREGSFFFSPFFFSDLDLEKGPPRSAAGTFHSYGHQEVGDKDGDISHGGDRDVEEDSEENICRVCHMPCTDGDFNSGQALSLGCKCKDALSLAHRQCAETWFSIRGNRVCEICGATTQNLTSFEEESSTCHSDERAGHIGSANEDEMGEHIARANANIVIERDENFLASNEVKPWWKSQRFGGACFVAFMMLLFIISWIFHSTHV